MKHDWKRFSGFSESWFEYKNARPFKRSEQSPLTCLRDSMPIFLFETRKWAIRVTVVDPKLLRHVQSC